MNLSHRYESSCSRTSGTFGAMAAREAESELRRATRRFCGLNELSHQRGIFARTEDSTPPATSTPHGLDDRIASATFAAAGLPPGSAEATRRFVFAGEQFPGCRLSGPAKFAFDFGIREAGPWEASAVHRHQDIGHGFEPFFRREKPARSDILRKFGNSLRRFVSVKLNIVPALPASLRISSAND